MIGNLLRAGVVAAAAVVLLGAVVSLARHGGEELPDRSTFRPDELRSVGAVLDAARAGRGRGIIQLGLLLLIATPVVRVALSAFAFLRQRDALYVALTLVVLAALL